MKVANMVTAAAISAWLIVAFFGHTLLSDLAGRGVRVLAEISETEEARLAHLRFANHYHELAKRAAVS